MTGTVIFEHGALADLRVLELGTLLAGPFCGQLLGDMGAEIIKVEPPHQGEPMRTWGRHDEAEGPSLWWPVVLRNKKSITLDLRQSAGQEILKQLVEEVDLLIENFRPTTLEKWGLDYDTLSAINPRLIMIPRIGVRPNRPLRASGRLRGDRRGHGRAVGIRQGRRDPRAHGRHPAQHRPV